MDTSAVAIVKAADLWGAQLYPACEASESMGACLFGEVLLPYLQADGVPVLAAQALSDDTYQSRHNVDKDPVAWPGCTDAAWLDAVRSSAPASGSKGYGFWFPLEDTHVFARKDSKWKQTCASGSTTLSLEVVLNAWWDKTGQGPPYRCVE